MGGLKGKEMDQVICQVGNINKFFSNDFQTVLQLYNSTGSLLSVTCRHCPFETVVCFVD